MSENNEEIPGFYKDPVTGKYYADRPGVSSNPALKKLKAERCNSKECPVIPKITNVARYLNTRELRAIGGVQESREFLKMRLNLKERVRVLTEFFDPYVDINFITGSTRYIYGFWKNETSDIYNIGSLKLTSRPIFQTLPFFRMIPGYVIDMCEGFQDDYLVLYQSSYVHDQRMLLVHCGEANYNMKYYDDSVTQTFCISCNKKKLYHAFGRKNHVVFIDAEGRRRFVKNIMGRIHTVSFDDAGNLMVAGLHNGNLVFFDLRTEKLTMTIPVSTSCLIDSSIINSNHIIISGTNDVLCKVDIRKQEIVNEFLTYKQNGIKKAPVSVASNMLCAAGSDNKIKIWDLAGGLPLHVIKPSDPEDNIRAWLCDIGYKTNLYVFENWKRDVFEIL